MKAMILAAGMGTRLRPFTNYHPKALVEVNGMPLLEIAIRRLMYFGCRDIIINVHHFAEQIIRFLERNEHFGINIALSDEQDQLLNTGGGLKKAASFFDDGQAFLLCNTDILTNLDLNAFYQAHLDSEALVTLGVRRRDTSRYLIFDQKGLMHGWANVKSGELCLPRQQSTALQLWAFSGLHIIDPALFKLMPAEEAFSIIDLYLEVCADHPIQSYPHNDSLWLDVGRKEALAAAASITEQLQMSPNSIKG
ncbi:MAG: nucleotidyltransferase family protein [Bacteroidota bacterium]